METKKEKALIPVNIDEKNDLQLQRAVDLLKSWKVFREMPAEIKGDVKDNL